MRDAHHLLLMGRNDVVKGHEFAVQVANGLVDEFPNLKLTMTGVGHSNQTWIDARGWVNENEKKKLLQTASILLVPSAFEGQPLVVLESLACGLPVIVSDQVLTGVLPVEKIRYQDIEAWQNAIRNAFNSPNKNKVHLEESVADYRIKQVSHEWSELYRS